MIPVNEPLLVGNEKKYLLECIETGWISSEGPFVREFEEKFAAYMDRSYGVAVANGSGALDIAVAALDLGPGDEVIVPSFTIISPLFSILRSGAMPVLVDSLPDTWNMDPDQVINKITPKTKAIIIVHIYGLPVDMDPILEAAHAKGIYVIEDAAEMHGQTYRGKRCGSFGDISTFSFYPNKHVTTGEGGMTVTNDPKLAEKMRRLRNLSFQPGKRFVHEDMGWNYRMTNMQAAIGLAQLEQLDSFVKKKKNMGVLYNDLLSNQSLFDLPLAKTEYADNIYWVYGLLIKPEVDANAEYFMEKLREKKIGTRPFFFPMHRQPVLLKKGYFKDEKYPVADSLYEKGFYVPSGMALTEDQQKQVVSELLSTI